MIQFHTNNLLKTRRCNSLLIASVGTLCLLVVRLPIQLPLKLLKWVYWLRLPLGLCQSPLILQQLLLINLPHTLRAP